LLGLIVLISAARAQEVIAVKNWPADVPCTALKNNPNNGTWTVTRTLVLPGDIRIYGGTSGPTGSEAKAWERKMRHCRRS